VNDGRVSVDESPADRPQDETERPEFPGFREGEDDGPMPEAGGSVEAPEEDAELEAARVDETVEAEESSGETDAADAVENETDVVDADEGQEDTAVVIENADRTDTALEDERPDEPVEEATADVSETVPELPTEDPVASDELIDTDDAGPDFEDQSLSGAAPLGSEESEGDFGTGAPVEDPTAETAAPAAEAAPAEKIGRAHV